MLRLALLMLLYLPSLSGSAADRYRLDPVHTRVLFAIDHAGFSQAMGTISGSEGLLEFDPDDWNSARLEVSIPVDRVDLGDEKWNRATLARNLLDGQRHPQARFVSTGIEAIDAQHARIHGQLTLRGVTREVVLDTRLNALRRLPLPPFHRIAGFSATAILRRSDFGIDAWKSMIGDEVRLRIEVEAIADDKAAPPAASPDAAGDADDIQAAADAALALPTEPESRP